MAAYIPKKGDFITVTFDPQSGHEQKGNQSISWTTWRI
jgi:mRNA interferase MazF